ncbi:MAG: hypothetical protein U9Q80_02260 [Bacillota bacterium]|nr:hypothetical protein [Bacillota bacterium]
MKKKLLFVLIITLILQLMACSHKDSRIESAKNISNEYLSKLYTIDDYTQLDYNSSEKLDELYKEYVQKFQNLVTEDMIELIKANREITLIVKTAIEKEINIEVIGIEFNQINEDEDKIFLNFELSLKLIYSDGTSETVIKNGALQLIDNDGLKINHCKGINYPFEILD